MRILIVISILFSNIIFGQINSSNKINSVIKKYFSNEQSINIDSQLQKKHNDTLLNIGRRLSGEWKYLGKEKGDLFIDTLHLLSKNRISRTDFVKNGIVYIKSNHSINKADYYIKISFEFYNKTIGMYMREKVFFNKNMIETSSCEPLPEVVFYNEKYGIIFHGVAGETFKPIAELSIDRLKFENGKCYEKIDE